MNQTMKIGRLACAPRGKRSKGRISSAWAGRWAAPIMALVFLQLTGCGAVVTEGVSITADKTKIRNNIEAARAGDAAAQYVVGKAMCCSGASAEGTFYSTEDALEWLCKSADQGNPDAMLKLAEIFEGKQVKGVRLARRAAALVSDTPTDRAIAYYWYQKAADAGADKADTPGAKLFAKMTSSERTEADRYLSVAAPPCCWTALAETPSS